MMLALGQYSWEFPCGPFRHEEDCARHWVLAGRYWLWACDHPGCGETVPADPHWAVLAAAGQGWFFGKDERAWCPVHLPPWVTAWRARQEESGS